VRASAGPTGGASGGSTQQILSVIARDYKNSFIKGVAVTVVDAYHHLSGNATTDAWGQCDFQVNSGVYNVTVAYSSIALNQSVTVLATPETVNFTFPIEAFVSPSEMFFDTTSFLMFILGSVGIAGAVYFEKLSKRKHEPNYRAVGASVAFVSVGVFIYGGMLAAKMVKPMFVLPSFSVNLGPVSFDFVGEFFSSVGMLFSSWFGNIIALDLNTILLTVSLAICGTICVGLSYHFMSGRSAKHGKQLSGRFQKLRKKHARK
jgi:hypothetical protein